MMHTPDCNCNVCSGVEAMCYGPEALIALCEKGTPLAPAEVGAFARNWKRLEVAYDKSQARLKLTTELLIIVSCHLAFALVLLAVKP